MNSPLSSTSAATNALMAEAAVKADALLKATQQSREGESTAARTRSNANSALLAVDIAGKLLARLNSNEVHTTFLHWLVETIEQMSTDDKVELLDSAGGIDLVSAVELDDVVKSRISLLVGGALNGKPIFNFVTDPDLIAGFEIRTAH